MTTDGKFNPETIQTLSRRAALLCSNPDCGVLTSGPATDTISVINIGEAAHIYGRRNISARYNPELNMAEVSDITNGIWLCRNCHKLVDNDALRFPVELLFEWRRQHERAVTARLGKPGEQLREKVRAEQMELFESASRLAQQIVLDRPPMWEFKLAAEILRTGLGTTYQGWQQLKQGMYIRKSTIIPDRDLPTWFSAKFSDLSSFIQAMMPLLKALNQSFGEQGQAGSDKEILSTCTLIVATANNLLEWEEDVRFVHVSEKYRDVLATMRGVAGQQLDQLLRIPGELSKIVSMENPEGFHKIDLVFTMPDGFVENFRASLERALTGA
jgi:hypothetical protein